jgi:methionine-rich copper-binding protein CopC
MTLLLTTTAAAHAAYKGSDPADGSSVSSPPSRVIAEFTEPVVQDSYLEVYDPCGARVDNGDSLVASDRITVTMSADKQGTYTVVFNVVSAVDGHNTSGDFTFSSTGGAPCPGAEPEPENPPPSNTGGGGNGGGGGSNGGSNTGPASAAGPASAQPQTSAAAGASTATSNGGKAAAGRDKAQAVSKNGGRPRGTRQEQPRTFVEVPADEGVALEAAASTSSGGEIPLDGVIIALVLATLIGAAAGHVYAGLLDPHS